MKFVELPLRLAVACERASGDALFDLVRGLDDELEVHLFIERDPPGWQLRVLGLLVDEVVVERVLPVRWALLDEVTKLTLLAAYAEDLHVRNERWKRSMNPKLVALGVRPIS